MKRLSLLVALGACGTSTPDVAPDAAAAVVVDAASPDAVGTFVASGTIYDEMGTPLPGARMCILDHAELACEVTDGAGAWAMTIPHSIDRLAFNATLDGYLGVVMLYEETGGDAWPSGIPLMSLAEATQNLGTGTGFAVPTNGTGIALIYLTSGAPGAMATLAPASPAVYTDASRKPDRALTATTSSDVVLFGNLAPGFYTVTASAPGKTCTVRPHGGEIVGDWFPAGSETMDIEIAADSFTYGGQILCE